MITEDYVSFETAKLLKEKGFDEATNRYYNAQYDQIRTVSDTFMWHWNDEKFMKHVMMEGAVAIPTIQMTMKWLREVYNLVIEPYRTACGYLYTISSIPYGSTKYDNSEAYNGDDEASGQWTTWEKACEDGIKYCLENLI